MESKPGTQGHQPLLPSGNHTCTQTRDILPSFRILHGILHSQMNLFLKLQVAFYKRRHKQILIEQFLILQANKAMCKRPENVSPRTTAFSDLCSFSHPLLDKAMKQ